MYVVFGFLIQTPRQGSVAAYMHEENKAENKENKAEI